MNPFVNCFHNVIVCFSMCDLDIVLSTQELYGTQNGVLKIVI